MRPRLGPVEGTWDVQFCLGPAAATVGSSAASEPGLLTGPSLASRLQTLCANSQDPAWATLSPQATLPLLTWASGTARSQIPTAAGPGLPAEAHGS